MNKNLRYTWGSIPGVVFPKAESVVVPKGYSPKTKRPYTKPPRGYISTKQAADILRSGHNAAYVKLLKHKIKSVLVNPEGCRQRFWRKSDVEHLADKAPPFGSWEDVTDMLSMEEFVSKTGVGRSVAVRAIQKGKLHAVAYRMPTGQGRQKRFFITHEELERYVEARKNSSRAKKEKKPCGSK